MSKMRYLIRRNGGGLAVRVAKPRHLCPNGKAAWTVRGLGTRDVEAAQSLKWKVLAEIRADWEREAKSGLSLTDEALEWAQDIKNSDRPSDLELILTDRAEQIEEKLGAPEALRFYKVATGAVPLSRAIKLWEKHIQGQLTEATIAGDLKEMRAFATWAVDRPIDEVGRKLAQRFVMEQLLAPNSHGVTPKPATVRRKISSLSKLFKFFDLAINPMANPFDRLQALAQGGKKPGGSAEKKAFTLDELKRLETWIRESRKGAARTLELDAVRLLSHTGMRFGEAMGLTAADAGEDESSGVVWLTVRAGKTDNAQRTLPVTDLELRLTLKARMAAQPGDGSRLIFHELQAGLKQNDPKKALGKRLRRAIANALPERQGKLDVHSFRRLFATIAEAQGVDPNVLARVMGHEAPSFSLRQYSGGPGKKLLVEAMRMIEGALEEPTLL